MTRSKPIAFLATAAVIPLTALAVTGCGGNNNATGASPSPKPANTRPASVKVANSGLGKILVDSNGRTLYLFAKDSGTNSACAGACAAAWPPLRTSGKPVAGSGANASLVGTTTRSDGKPQVTYHGHPLYTFVKDQKPGDTNGEGLTAFGGSWFVLSPAGNEVSGKAAPAPATPTAPKKTAPQPAAPAAPKPQPKAQPKPKSNIPQNGGGDGDADNNGGPDDGDGGL